MLQAVHTPCVMKNARPEMYRYASYITENDNNNSGIAEIIEKFML
jgi:hydroxymethylpyrimidine pyrophosphatase-like HAD family hydrolase